MKKLYRTALHTNLMKDLKVEELSKAADTINTQSVQGGDQYQNFTCYFSANEISYLRSQSYAVSNDSTFIGLALKYLYNDRPNSLLNVSITGKSQGTTVMSPEKLGILRSLFDVRMGIIGAVQTTRHQRFKDVLSKVLYKHRTAPSCRKRLSFPNSS